MTRSQNFVYNISLFLNCLLLFLLIFEQRLAIPVSLQVVGRAHPLILHFPIVLVVICAGLELFFTQRTKQQNRTFLDALLLLTAFTSVISAVAGLFLSREEGYDPAQLNLHKWTGVALSFLTLAWYAFREALHRIKGLSAATASIGLVIMVVAGHQGAGLTHGEDFLLAPMAAAEAPPPVPLEDAEVFAHMVQPILEAKCAGCHNPNKAKGGLIMTSAEGLLKGGKNGHLWDTTEQDLGLMLRRVGLPLSHKKHMPPQGKPQLDDEEIQIINLWVRTGAPLEGKVLHLPADDTLRMLAERRFEGADEEGYDFAAADVALLEKLSDNYRIITPIAAGSPALQVSFYGAAQYQPQALEALKNIEQQVVQLNLSKMPLTDTDLSHLAQFVNLRQLNLSFTKVTDEGVGKLTVLQNLRQLSLSGTAVTDAAMTRLARMPKLTHLYLWQTAVTAKAIAQLQQKKIQVQTGYSGDTVVMQLSPPLIENDEPIITKPIPLRLRHAIKGADIRYTTDGSEPDSISSPRFAAGVVIDRNMRVRAKVFKQGWRSSEIIERQFLRAGLRPDSVRLLQRPEEEYTPFGGGILTDGKKGEYYFRSGRWLGYRTRPLDALFFLPQTKPFSSATFSFLYNIDGYIMPPSIIEVWGGPSEKSLKLLKKVTPNQPEKSEPQSLQAVEVTFPKAEVAVIRIKVQPVKSLPAWHPGKGERGWLFIDEVVFN